MRQNNAAHNLLSSPTLCTVATTASLSGNNFNTYLEVITWQKRDVTAAVALAGLEKKNPEFSSTKTRKVKSKKCSHFHDETKTKKMWFPDWVLQQAERTTVAQAVVPRHPISLSRCFHWPASCCLELKKFKMFFWVVFQTIQQSSVSQKWDGKVFS